VVWTLRYCTPALVNLYIQSKVIENRFLSSFSEILIIHFIYPILTVYFGGIYFFTYQVIEAFTGHREATSSRWRWLNCPCSFTIRKARPFSAIVFKTSQFSSSLFHVKVAILVAFYNAFKANNPQRTWSHFSAEISAFTKNKCFTPGYTGETRFSYSLLLIFNSSFNKNQELENRTFDWVRLYNFFVWVPFCSSTKHNRLIHGLSSMKFDWVRLKNCLIGFDSLHPYSYDMHNGE